MQIEALSLVVKNAFGGSSSDSSSSLDPSAMKPQTIEEARAALSRITGNG
jgi:hypothetical protein